MSVMFSKVTLTADNGSAATLLCSGSPKDHYDLEDWTIYQKFMSDNLDSKSVKAEVDTYLYGEGDVFIANIYEVAAFTASRRALAGQLGVYGLSSCYESAKTCGQSRVYLI